MINQRDPMERAEHEAEQCNAETARGRCLMKKVESTDFCTIHAGHRQLAKQKRENLYDLHRSKYLASQKQYDSQKYDLSAELAVSRTFLSKYLDKIESFETLLQYDHKVQALLDKIQKLSDSILKADQKLGTLMSEEDALAIGQGLIDAVHEILSKHIEDPEQFAEAMSHIGETFEKVINERGSDKT